MIFCQESTGDIDDPGEKNVQREQIRISVVFCAVSFSVLSKTWARNNACYLLQKDGQLRSELFLQLWVPGKQGVIHQNLVQRDKDNRHSPSGYCTIFT